MSQVITNAFEQYWQSSLAAEQPVVLDEFILADIPNLDITSPIDPDTGLPPESQIVHRQNVDQRGRINNNAVAYTIVMDTTVGDFSFNAMYLRNKANGVIGMIVYKGRETKLKTDQTTGQTGNSLVKSMLMGYDQAAEATLTHVDAGTWQIDYAARLRGQDEELRQLASQLYGHHTFIGDGFKVVQQDGGHQVTTGVAIIGGLRVELKAPEVIYPGSKPIGVWVDVHRAGSLLSEHQNHFTIITSVADLTDHVDSSGYQHYVAKLGTVQADNTVVDGRVGDGLLSAIANPVTWVGFVGGADPTGATESFDAFQEAVNQAKGSSINLPVYAPVPMAPFVTIRIPTGTYKVSSKVSPKGQNVIWVCDAGVNINSFDNLCGRVIQSGVRHNVQTNGSHDSAAGFSIVTNRGQGKGAAVQGIVSPSDLRTVTERDSVGFYTDNCSLPPTLTVASATYTETTAIPSSPIDVSQLIPGMIIDTDNGYAGVLSSFDKDGASITVQDGWYISGAAGSSAQTPEPAGFKVNAITKIWAMNAQAILDAAGNATRGAGYELGLRNAKHNPNDPSDLLKYLWGYDVVGFGPYPASVGFLQRGGILRGFESSGASLEGFAVTPRNGVTPVSAFVSKCNAFQQFAAIPDGQNACFKVTNVGDMDIGGQAYQGTKTTRIRSSGLNNDYDTRTQSVGGTAMPGQGTYRITALHTEVSGSIRPVSANTSPCGTSANPWSGGFTQSAFTVTSDERCKTDPLDISDVILDAWEEVNWAKFKYLDRIEAKGEDHARWHFGVIAQRTMEAFEQHGLNAREFAFLCYDEWGDEFEDIQTNLGEFTTEMVKVEEPSRVDIPAFLPDGQPLIDGNGKQIIITTTAMTEVWVESHTPVDPVFERVKVREAGSRYGILYEEALVMEAALQRRNYQRQKQFNIDILERIEGLEVR